MKIIGGIAVFFGLMFYSALAVVLGWSWFMVPLGLPGIGYAHAMGISGLSGLLTYHGNPNSDKSFTQTARESFVRITVILAFMWAYAQFM